RFERIDLVDDALELLEQAVVAAAEDAGEQAIEHGCTGWWIWMDAGRRPGRGVPQMKKGRRAPFLATGHCTWRRRQGVSSLFKACFRASRPQSHPRGPAACRHALQSDHAPRGKFPGRRWSPAARTAAGLPAY